MARYLAVVASTLLLFVAIMLIWKGSAAADRVVPPVPSAAALLTPLRSGATPDPPSADRSREERRFARYDADENGIITRAEMMETRRKPFAKLDKDSDGRLSFEEWAVTTADKFADADADKSATLDRAEFLTTKRETKTSRCTC
ncbi:MAG: histidine kinase [Alphaproteobacteria bacterium]|nr:histidine kinase [Alphaproteobacteria bacterium]